MYSLQDKRILFIVGGGIAAYKAPLVVRALIKEGAEARVALTRSASQFVAPLALQAVSQHRVAHDLFDPTFEDQIGHIELARWPDAVLIAPATANLIARMAAGLANDLPTTLLLATRAPVLLAPAMNTQMLLHPATQRNLETLQRFGHTLIPPDSGELACLEVGPGRQPDPERLVEAVLHQLAPKPWKGKHLLVTAGPTRAFLDPVRFLSNPSTGRMGVALARAAHLLGAQTTLVSGPIHLDAPLPVGVTHIPVETTPEMANAVLSRFDTLDGLIMAAAVGDYTPAHTLEEKRKKTRGDSTSWTLELERTTDILAAAGARRGEATHPLLIGFAAETHHMEQHAREKLERKGCDVILGNWVRSAQGDTFGADHAKLLAIGRRDWRQLFGPGTKDDVALEVLSALAQRFLHTPGSSPPDSP